MELLDVCNMSYLASVTSATRNKELLRKTITMKGGGKICHCTCCKVFAKYFSIW